MKRGFLHCQVIIYEIWMMLFQHKKKHDREFGHLFLVYSFVKQLVVINVLLLCTYVRYLDAFSFIVLCDMWSFHQIINIQVINLLNDIRSSNIIFYFLLFHYRHSQLVGFGKIVNSARSYCWNEKIIWYGSYRTWYNSLGKEGNYWDTEDVEK